MGTEEAVGDSKCVLPDPGATYTDWRLWCRLCAKEDPQRNINVFFKKEQIKGRLQNCSNLSLGAVVKKYFAVNITQEEELPKVLCTECISVVASLISFSERVTRVQNLFCTIQNFNTVDIINLNSLRIKYGVTDEDSEHILVQQRPPEVQFFETKPQLNELEERVLETDSTVVDPLGTLSVEIKFEKENALDDGKETDDSYDMSDVGFVTPRKPKSRKPAPKSNIKDNKRRKRKTNCAKSELKRMAPPKKKETYIELNDNHEIARSNCDKMFSCSECPKQFKRIPNFRQHMKRIHPDSFSTNSEFHCGECPRTFPTQFRLERHAKTHLPIELTKIIPCPYCDKKFTTNCILHTHINNVHMNKREFICEECGLAVQTKEVLREHMLTHSDYTPFECNVCKKAFKTEKRLKRHMEVHDTTKHTCDKCGRVLNSRETLKRHLIVHSDEMKHKCDYCGRAFKRSKTLKTHLIRHTGLKPYLCEFCNSSFPTSFSCRLHKKKSHPEEFAALEESGEGRTYTRNIPKLNALKAICGRSKASNSLVPVIAKKSGRLAF